MWKYVGMECSTPPTILSAMMGTSKTEMAALLAAVWRSTTAVRSVTTSFLHPPVHLSVLPSAWSFNMLKGTGMRTEAGSFSASLLTLPS